VAEKLTDDYDSPLKNDELQMRIVGFCHRCTHRTSVLNCTAFPDGIPSDILAGRFIHTRRWPGQTNDIVFEANDVPLK
jgi:hypothetical protein